MILDILEQEKFHFVRVVFIEILIAQHVQGVEAAAVEFVDFLLEFLVALFTFGDKYSHLLKLLVPAFHSLAQDQERHKYDNQYDRKSTPRNVGAMTQVVQLLLILYGHHVDGFLQFTRGRGGTAHDASVGDKDKPVRVVESLAEREIYRDVPHCAPVICNQRERLERLDNAVAINPFHPVDRKGRVVAGYLERDPCFVVAVGYFAVCQCQ